MPALHTAFSHLLIYDPDKSRTTVHSASARPTPLEERALGRLFLLVEVDSAHPENHQVIEELQNIVTAEYYGSESFQVEHAFERALQKTNERLRDRLSEQLEELLPRLNVVIAVLKDTSLHFTVIGRMHAFLIHGQRIIDILDSSDGASSEPPSPLKIFTNVISGQLNLSDTLLICTTSLLDHFSQEKLKRMTIGADPQAAAEALESSLAEADSGSGFGAIIIRLAPAAGAETREKTEPEYALRSPGIPSPTQDSMERLIAKERATNSLLTHSLWPNLGRLVSSGISRARGDRQRSEPSPEATEETPATSMPSRRLSLQPTGASARIGGVAVTIGRGILLGLSSALRGLWKLLLAGVMACANLFRRSRARAPGRSFSSTANRKLSHGARWFERLTPGRRRILLVAVVLLLLFSQSIVSLGNGRESKKNRVAYENYLQEAKEKISAADAALLIKNESSARALLAAASDALAKIPDVKQAPRDEAASTKKLIETKLQSIRHVVTVSPVQVVDLAGLDAGFAATALGFNGGALYTFNSRTSSIYKVDLQKKTASTTVDAPSLDHQLRSFVRGGTSPILLGVDGSLQSIASGNASLASVPVQYANVDHDVVDAAVYNGRLYTLDPRNNQIFRHEKSGAGFGLGIAWVTEVGNDLHETVSFAIDGSIYLLRRNGDLMKFSGGKKAATFDAADPAMTEATRVFTNDAAASVFVLDANQRRVVEYSKDGGFARQYQADALSNATDIVVDKSSIYILAGTQILAFPASTEAVK